jgi:Domain of unknown function (DUF4331)
MKHRLISITAALAASALAPLSSLASSHMDAPLITLDPAANTTDVYAFVAAGESPDTNNYLVVGLGVYPFEEPGIGPNKYKFDDNVLYEIHICTANKTRAEKESDLAAGRKTISYQFNFTSTYRDPNTILASYLGVITNIGDASQNLLQTYNVTKVDHRTGKITVLGSGLTVPPNNEGDATPFYNQGNDGNNPAQEGVTNSASLDPYTTEAIHLLTNGSSVYEVFAGQRDDGFYADVLAVFDLLQLRPPASAHDSQKGFNIHTMVLRVPLSEIGGEMQTVGVYATTSRRAISVLRAVPGYTEEQLVKLQERGQDPFEAGPKQSANILGGNWVQVARQGNPLFNEVLVAVADEDLYSRTSPTVDSTLFAKYALNPEPCALFNLIYNGGVNNPNIETNRTDIASIYIPDLIKVDLSTGPARRQGGGITDPNYSSLGVFGGDVLVSAATGGTLSGGWPNGRRFGDNVVDVALKALLDSTNLAGPNFGLYTEPTASDGVLTNDVYYNLVFPYESTPHNGRNHTHD